MKKDIQYKVFFLILFISYTTFATAQEGSSQPVETTKPTPTLKKRPITAPNTSGTTVTNPKQTPETIVVPTQPIPQRRRRKPTLQDSIRLAAIREDSLSRAIQSTSNNNYT